MELEFMESSSKILEGHLLTSGVDESQISLSLYINTWDVIVIDLILFCLFIYFVCVQNKKLSNALNVCLVLFDSGHLFCIREQQNRIN